MDRRDGIFTIILLGLRVWFGHNYNGCLWSAGNSILVPAIAEINMMHLFLDNIDQTRTLAVSLTVLQVANEMLFGVTTNRAILNQYVFEVWCLWWKQLTLQLQDYRLRQFPA